MVRNNLALVPEPIGEVEVDTSDYRPVGKATIQFNQIDIPFDVSALQPMLLSERLISTSVSHQPLITPSPTEMPIAQAIHTFAPEPYESRMPLQVTIQAYGENNYVATFFDASIAASGDTQGEAFANLKAAILDAFDDLCDTPDAELGEHLQHQKRVLEDLIQAKK